MARFVRVPVFLAFLILCFRQAGNAIPVENINANQTTAVLNGTDGSTNVAQPTEALLPPNNSSLTNGPVSNPNVASVVPDASQSIAPIPSGGIVAALSQALNSVQAAQDKLNTILNGPGDVSNPATNTLDAPSTELLSTPPSVKNVLEPPKTINVTLGDGTTRFTPAIVKANPGDTIQFHWVGKNNHSVTETDVLGSCNKSLSPGAFDSGIQPPGTVWNLLLPSNARGLKFFYCKVAKHCEAGGMSGTILVPE